jgi:hypothetical protein
MDYIRHYLNQIYFIDKNKNKNKNSNTIKVFTNIIIELERLQEN